MVRQGLKQILELEDDIEVIAQAANGEEPLN
jgi:YesN/AraC family two-component response regulator